ncbi:hypothetical protein P7C73_g1055, partial [Tremellales sp. Uapishka_1]
MEDSAIIDVLSHLNHTQAQDDGELEGWSNERLREEVLRLRRETRPGKSSNGEYELDAIDPELLGKREHGQEDGGKKRKRVKTLTMRHEETGKRVEKSRRVELGKALRTKMKQSMQISADSPLPPPSIPSDQATLSDQTLGQNPSDVFIPQWSAGLHDDTNNAWVENIIKELIDEANLNGWPKVPPEDLDLAVVRASAQTAFVNFCKKYMADTNPQAGIRRERYIKGRRRWARKDLKQKRRSKASLDPAFDATLPPSALHFDYLSSEYSSAGEDSTSDSDKRYRRRERWTEMVGLLSLEPEDEAKAKGKGGWADGVGEKVLEVRKPRWRSEQLNDIYNRLDEISSKQSINRSTKNRDLHHPTTVTNTRPGHVAPSHKRFTMPQGLMRRGRVPKSLGEDWMWASGQVGVWEEEGAVVAAMEGVG